MAWHEFSKQICYCTNENWRDTPHSARAYTKEQAEMYITRSNKNRKRWGISINDYHLVRLIK
jgi:hypothetical protein